MFQSCDRLAANHLQHNAMNQPALTLEDIFVGQTFRTSEYTLSREAIKRFAGEFDPQPMHLDERAAERGPFGSLTASGWQTLALAMKLMAEARPFGDTPLLGVGVDEIRFVKPVFVNTTVYVVAEVISKRKSSKPGRGFVKLKLRVLNADNDQPVLSEVWTVLVPSGEP